MGCDSVCLTALRRSFNFNPRTHVGCDLIKLSLKICNYNFNPRTHVGCDFLSMWTLSQRRYFNPRTHVGCDRTSPPPWTPGRNFNPRTHVGCDQDHRRARPVAGISIHAPTWGATSTLFFCRPPDLFQSTHPRGVRHPSRRWRRGLGYFNPRTHVGCDVSWFKKSFTLLIFQSTHPRGVRRRNF